MAYAKRTCFDERQRREDKINRERSSSIRSTLTELPRSSVPLRCDMNNRPKNGLYSVTLRDFLQKYSEELGDYYGEDFGQDRYVGDYRYGDTIVFCLVDGGEDHLPADIKKKIRKAGKWRRNKLKHQWSYMNPLNRVHG